MAAYFISKIIFLYLKIKLTNNFVTQIIITVI